MANADEKMHHFQIGDTVIIRGDLNKQSIGKVEDIKHDQGKFSYFEYLRPEEVPGGRKSYHGKNELIKSDRVLEAKIEDVTSRCQICRLKNYVQNNYDHSLPAFVFRQYFDATNKKLIPEKLESQYFGEKVPNPDEEMMVNSYALNEENYAGDKWSKEGSDETMLSKRKGGPGGLDTMIPLKKERGGFDFTSFSEKKEGSMAQVKAESKKGTLAVAPKRPADRAKVVSMKSLTENPEERKHELMLKKVEQKAKAQLEKFRHSTPLSVQLPELEKIRQRIRENFFETLVYGLEECKLKQNISQTEEMKEYIVDISKFLMKDEKSQMEHIKNITFSIEANLYHKFNKEVGRSSAYNHRSRMVGSFETRSS